MSEKVVIVGGGAAGIDVLEFLLRGGGEDLEITLLKREREGFFSMCGLPFALQGMYGIEKLSIFGPEAYRERGVNFRTEVNVAEVDLDEGHVRLDSGEEISYDRLVIATGSRPFLPPVPGIELEGVHTLSSREDGVRIEAAMTSGDVKEAVVVGGGWIGLQAAVAFSDRDIDTRVVEMQPRLIPTLLDGDMASMVERWLKDDVDFVLGRSLDSINGRGRVESVMVGEEEQHADLVLVAAGMRPNVDLAEKAGMDLGESGGVVVDRAMRARRGGRHLDGVYALGDCAEVIDAVTLRPRLSQLASTALVQARVVADNILGKGSSYGTCLSPSVANIAGLKVGAVGVTAKTAGRYGIPVKVGRAAKYTRARFFPGRETIVAKLIFEASQERLIGAQVISGETVAERINELALGIRAGITAREIWMRERCFDPSLAMVEDVLVEAALRASAAQS